MEIKVLDKGFVRLDDFMGGDAVVCKAARVSTGKESVDPERDRGLIEYLIKNGHGTPFEHTVFRFHVKCPIFVMRQWVRHRIGSFNEMSGRYREMPCDFYFPAKWRFQKQPTEPGIHQIDHDSFSTWLDEHCVRAANIYHQCLQVNIAREMARMFLPLNLYTEFYWTVNLRSLFNFLKQRMNVHAQWEMRQYAFPVAFMVASRAPDSWSAYIQHDLKDADVFGYAEWARDHVQGGVAAQ